MDQSNSPKLERIAEVRHAEGLHMRPAMQFVDCASGYESVIEVHKDQQCVDGKSIMQMTMLAATAGTQLRITAQGPDADEALEALARVLECPESVA